MIPKTIQELAAECMELEDALFKAFPTVHFEPDGYITVTCCGEIRYGSGILGSDIIQCLKCGKTVFHVLSPHVSPFLRTGNSSVGIPDQATFEMFGNKVWYITPGDKENG